MNEQGKQVLASLRGKELKDLSLTDYHWMVAELAKLYEQADQHEATRQQRAHLQQRASSMPPMQKLLLQPEPLLSPHGAACGCEVCEEARAGQPLAR
jgi:hypothetical protein